MADGHNDSGILGVIEYHSCPFFMFWYLHTWWECLYILWKSKAERMATEEHDWPTASTKLLKFTSWTLPYQSQETDVNSAIWLCGTLLLPWLQDQEDEGVVAPFLAEPFFSSILIATVVNYSYSFCHVQSSSVLHAHWVDQLWCNLIQQWGNPVPSAKREVSLSWFIIIQRDGATIAILPQHSPKRECFFTCWEFFAVQSEFS